ncbi:MAG TPA: hypothetical protein VLA55_01910 [Ornithinibacter sp.]|nr:hypothetical protein [Ornithinibacter sp.]
MTLRAAAVGVVAGFVWGVVARGFMRLMTVAPEFTWSGTLYIVGTASVVGGLVAVVRQQRLAGRSWWWRLLGLPFILMFAGAGVVLVPGVVGVVMLLDRRRWLMVPGAALVGVTLWGVVVADLGTSMSARQWLGVAVMLGCLAVLGWAARELVRRWTPDAATSRLPLAESDTGVTLAHQRTGR